MRSFLAVLLLPVALLAAGGDTIQYPSAYTTFADGDTFFVNIHYKPPFDSVQRVVNGRLGNTNFATDANISAAKIDTTSDLNCDYIRGDSVSTPQLRVSDSAYIDTLTSARAYLTRITGGDVVVTDTVQGVTVYGSTTVSGATLSGTNLTISDSAYIDTLKSEKAYLTRISATDLIVSDSATCATMVLQQLSVSDSAYIDTLTSARAYLTRTTGGDVVATDTVQGATVYGSTAVSGGRITGSDVVASDTVQGATLSGTNLTVSDSGYIDTLTSARAYLTRITGGDIVVTDTVRGVTVYGSGTVAGGDITGTTITGTNLTIYNSSYIDTLSSTMLRPTAIEIGKLLADYDTGGVFIADDTISVGNYLLYELKPQGGAALDTLSRISPPSSVGQIIIIKTRDSDKDVFVQQAAGGGNNLATASDFTLGSVYDNMVLMYINSYWVEVSRADN